MLVSHPLLEPQEDLIHRLVTVFEIDAFLPAIGGLERGLLSRGADRREAVRGSPEDALGQGGRIRGEGARARGT